MPFIAADLWQQASAKLFTTWKMSFQSVHFLLFLPVVAVAYFCLPKRLRTGWLLLASYYFYFFAAPAYLPVLVAGTLCCYLFGLWIAAGKTPGSHTRRMALAVAGCVLALVFFKYNALLFGGIMRPLLAAFGVKYDPAAFSTMAAVGISFYTFTPIRYLVDVARGDVPPEKNLLRFAVFLAFFPSVMSGPISRAGALLPQLCDNDKKFDPSAAGEALVQMALGFFKKLAVADMLGVFVGAVYKNPDTLRGHSGFTLTLAAVGFMLQLYFDFAGYSDIALGTAKLLGIQLPQNFNTPYFATNFSGFWARWHMSLSAWLQDYIFTPLVWSRWAEKLPVIGKRIKKPPVLFALFAVFFISGVWHGDTLCFVVWGVLQAAFRIGEEVLHRTVGKPRKNPPALLRFGKTAAVLVLWCESLVFFKVGGIQGSVGDAFAALVRQFGGTSLPQALTAVYGAFLGAFLNKGPLAGLMIAFMLACLVLALAGDWAEYHTLAPRGHSLTQGIARLKTPARWLVYYLLVLGCFAAFLAQNGGFGGASFIYAQF